MSLTAAQKEWRSGHIGASEIAALFLDDFFLTPADIYARLVLGAETKETDSMRAGNVFEDAILDWFESEVDVVGDWVELGRERQFQARSNHLDHVGATCDLTIFVALCKGATCGQGIPVEAKYVSRHHPTHSQYGAKGTDQVPLPMRLQVMTQIACTGAEVGYVVAFREDHGFGWWKIERDEELIEEIRRRATNFWTKHIEPQVPPSKTVAKCELLRSIDRVEGKTKNLEPLLVAAVAEARQLEKEANTAARRITNQRKFLESIALQEMQDAQAGLAPGREIWVERSPRSGYYVEEAEVVSVRIRETEMREASEVIAVEGAIEAFLASRKDGQ